MARTGEWLTPLIPPECEGDTLIGREVGEQEAPGDAGFDTLAVATIVCLGEESFGFGEIFRCVRESDPEIPIRIPSLSFFFIPADPGLPSCRTRGAGLSVVF